MYLFMSAAVVSVALVLMTYMLTTKGLHITLKKQTEVDYLEHKSATAPTELELDKDLKSAYEFTRELQSLFLDEDQLSEESEYGEK